MKANNGKGNTPLRDLWQTPQWLFDSLDDLYSFDIDVCATKDNSKCDKYLKNFFLERNLNDFVCWMNPPFSKSKEMFHHFFRWVKKGVAIYRCDNLETQVWQDIIFPKASWIFIPDKRIVYEGMDGKGSRFPSTLIGFNVPKPTGLKGVILEVSLLSSHD